MQLNDNNISNKMSTIEFMTRSEENVCHLQSHDIFHIFMEVSRHGNAQYVARNAGKGVQRVKFNRKLYKYNTLFIVSMEISRTRSRTYFIFVSIFFLVFATAEYIDA